MTYDKNNIFARILRGDIPAKKVYENDHVLAFEDIAHKAKVHVLVIPKGEFASHDDFANRASAEQIVAFTKAISHVTKFLGVDKTGFRLISNQGAHSHQEVPHYHVHILGGQTLGPLLAK